MEQEEYLKNRLDDQIDWYDRKSMQNQKWFKRFQVVSIIAAASIPFLSGYITETNIAMKLPVGVLGVVVAAITAILGFYKFQENWLAYRTTCESLRHEKYLFLTKSEPYDSEDAFKLLVARVEGLISKENTNWHSYMQIQKDKKKAG
jgi:hypothetical protein